MIGFQCIFGSLNHVKNVCNHISDLCSECRNLKVVTKSNNQGHLKRLLPNKEGSFKKPRIIRKAI